MTSEVAVAKAFLSQLGHENLVMLARIVGALLIGAAIGLERTFHGRPAGFRTHALVCAASSLLMLVTVYQNEWMTQVTPDAIRTDPGMKSLTVNDVLIVASGNTPTTSPRLSASRAALYEAMPASRSTEMWRMPRISGPPTRCSKISRFAMKRTNRFEGRPARPQKMKSR